MGPSGSEPTTYEDQKKRFLDHLHELRCINEGDDNTDAPGYALNLVRLPVSVFLGQLHSDRLRGRVYDHRSPRTCCWTFCRKRSATSSSTT